MIATENNLTCDVGDLNPYRRHSVRFNGDPHLVPLRANGPRPPLFCFNAIDGNANAYQDFVSRLSIDIPVYGFQAIHGEAAPESLGQIAQEHADSICRIAANSPVRLFGFSFGALVAMHTAAVLEARFRRVQFVAVVDHRPFAAGDLAAKKRYLADYIRVVYSHLSSRLSVLRQISAPELRAAADAIAGHFVYDDSDPSTVKHVAERLFLVRVLVVQRVIEVVLLRAGNELLEDLRAIFGQSELLDESDHVVGGYPIYGRRGKRDE